MAQYQDENNHTVYQIKIRGYLDRRWIDHFYGMAMTHEEDGTTTLQGTLPDQTVLHTILLWIRDKNLRLISVNPAASCPDEDQDLL